MASGILLIRFVSRSITNVKAIYQAPILDRLQWLDYTRRFKSDEKLGFQGRVLCRNARFNLRCAVATRHTVFARA
jgi:hypothetical protein